jgi:hypothetical protein
MQWTAIYLKLIIFRRIKIFIIILPNIKNLIGDMNWIIFGGIYITGRRPKKNEDSLPVGKQTDSFSSRTVVFFSSGGVCIQ